MFKKANEITLTMEPGLKGGQGTVKVLDLVTPEEMKATGAGRLFGVSMIPVGGSIGYHTHAGDFEIYYILQGKGRLTLDGVEHIVEPGDVTMCPDGHSHSMENIGDEPLHYLASILYTR